MLIQKIREVYRDFIDPVVAVEPMKSARAESPASNASDYSRCQMKARRQRRNRRLGRAAAQNMHGWAVRTW